tara:strand:+ start:587 stop:802 length:216 start_codon:yes stop_codon:yes gene_type:complete
MHKTTITNFPQPKTASNSFATLKIEVDKLQHISTYMASEGSEVTIFFDSMEEVNSFIANLTLQSSQARQGK